jgi:hypothetical protein
MGESSPQNTLFQTREELTEKAAIKHHENHAISGLLALCFISP